MTRHVPDRPLRSEADRIAASPQESSDAALKCSVSLLQAALEATTDGLLIVGAQGRITGYNQKFLQLWRISDDQVTGATDQELLHHVSDQLTEPEAFLAKVNELYQQPAAVSFDTLSFRDGRCFERYSLPQVVQDVPVGRVWSFRDVTARTQDERRRKELDDQLQQGQRMEALGTLAGGIAHDFNNLLTVILGRAELARDSVGDEAVLTESLREITDAGTRASDLVRRIREFSQRQAPDRSAVPFGATIAHTLQLLRATLPSGIELVESLDTSIVLQANASQLQQVVTNLVVNAGDAIGNAAGQIAVTLESLPGSALPASAGAPQAEWYACLTVSDSGCGIAPEVAPRIFEPFFSTRRGDGGGVGLGLAAVYGSVQRHGGAITVESTPGNGATFRVFWPAATRLTETSAPTPRSFGSGLPRGDNRHVLVVDDELGIVRVIAASLKRLGYQVTTCTDPREALASFEATPDSFDVVLTDLSMPHMSGLELGRSLLDLRADLPIVLFTGYNADLSAETVHAAGFRALLSKPTTPSSLAEVLHQTLHSP